MFGRFLNTLLRVFVQNSLQKRIWDTTKHLCTQFIFTCSKLITETLEKGVKYVLSMFFIVNSEHISHRVLVFLVLHLNRLMMAAYDGTSCENN